MRMKNIYTLLGSVGLLNLLGTSEVRKALDLWNSGIINHEETLERLGGHPYGVLTHKEYRMLFGYLHETLCR